MPDVKWTQKHLANQRQVICPPPELRKNAVLVFISQSGFSITFPLYD